MIGPKRGIDMFSAVLIEYDMRIKKGEQEADDNNLVLPRLHNYTHSLIHIHQHKCTPPPLGTS